MFTSIIRHPGNERINIIRQSQLAACEGNECAARLLGLFEYMTNNKLANRTYLKFMSDALTYQNQRGIPENTGYWLPYTDKDLMEGILNSFKTDSISKALEYLEKRGFIETGLPENLQKYFHSGKTKWIAFKPEAYRAWLENYTFIVQGYYSPAHNTETAGLAAIVLWLLSQKINEPEQPQLFQMEVTGKLEKIKSKVTNKNRLEPFMDDAYDLFNFWREIHNHKQSIPDDERLQMIATILSVGAKIAQAAQAIIGNLFSDFHQAKNHPRNPNNIVFDRIKDIFETMQKFESMIAHAEGKGVNDSKAMYEFEMIKAGKVSKYAKKRVKSQPSVKETPSSIQLTPENVIISGALRDFASELAPYLASNNNMPFLFEKACELLTPERRFTEGLKEIRAALQDELKSFSDLTAEKIKLIEVLSDRICTYKQLKGI